MNRDQKAVVIDEVASQIKEAQAIFAVDYRGLTVRQAADLRGRLIELDASLRVVKNTLTERAADQVGAEPLKVMPGQRVGLVASPLSGLVRTLNALLSGIAVALGQIQEQGLVGANAAPPEPAAEAPAAESSEAPAAAEADAPAETSAPDAI